MIKVQPFDDLSAMAVFSRLDPHDVIEAQVMRGAVSSHLALFCDWRAMQLSWAASYVLSVSDYEGFTDGPFAVVCLGNTGQAGVAQGAFLARRHDIYRGPIARAAVLIRHQLPLVCQDLGIHRVEARCYDGHPTAQNFLRAVGFNHEVAMPGFGPKGTDTFHQFGLQCPSNKKTEKTNV